MRRKPAEDRRNLYQQGEVWYLKIQIDGREHRESLRTTVLTEARALRDQRIPALKGELHAWQDAVVQWASEYLPHNVKPATAKRYLCSIDQIRQAVVSAAGGGKTTLERLCVEQVSVKTVAEVVAWSKKHRPGLTHATLRRDLTALSSVLHMCVGLGWMMENPAKGWDRSHIKERREPIMLPRVEDIDRVAATASPMLRAAIRLAQYTGMRQEEIFGLRWQQVARDNRAVTLTKTKSSRTRVVPMDSRAVSILTSIPRNLHCPYVFWRLAQAECGRQEAVRISNPSSGFRNTRDRAGTDKHGITFRFHDLRHWFAVDYLQRGAGSIYDLQGVLGHSSVKVTELYLDYLDPETRQRAVRHVGGGAGYVSA